MATSAFGLGINRPDIRTVFCVSPPTDLAALYQQLGRAGRDAAGQAIVGAADPDDDGMPSTSLQDCARPANTGLALLTSRGLRTVAFMTGQDLPGPLLHRMAQAVLSCGGVLDSGWAAERLIGEDVATGRLNRNEAGQRRTLDTYTAGVVRAFAALAEVGAVTDLGDFPPLAVVKAGELLGRDAPDGDPSITVERAVATALLTLPNRRNDRRELQRSRLDVPQADAWLAATVPGYRDVASHPPETWQLLADLHDRGQLDVSAAPSRKLVTGVDVHVLAVPAGFPGAVAGKAARAAAEISLLQDFFTDRGTCANRKFADYFGADVPSVCCTTAENRCSTCWDYRADWPASDSQPVSGAALMTDRPRPAGWRVDAAAKARRLDEPVRMLLWAVDRGLSTRDVQLALRGQDTWFYARERRWVRLPTAVVTSRFFGVNPSVRLPQVEDALARLAADSRAVAVGHRWRDAGNVARERRRLAKQAAAGAVL